MPEPLHLAVALDGAGWHPAAWREPGARPTELFTAGYWVDLVRRGRARPARLRDDRGLPRLQSADRSDARRPHRPGPRPARRGARRGPGGPADPPHRPGADRDRHAHRAVPPLQGDRHARLRQHRPRRCPRPGVGQPDRGRALRPAHGPSRTGSRTRTDRAARRRAVRRGRRLRRGRAPALGQLGGRRRDPRRRHRPVRRPRQAALHRLRGRALQRQRPVDHAAAAAGPADRRRARPRAGRRTGWSAAAPTSASSRPSTPADARAIVAEIRGRAVGGRAAGAVHVFGDLVVFLDDDAAAAPTARPAWTSCAGAELPQRRAGVRRHRRPSSPTCSRSGSRPGSPASGCGPAPCPHDLARDHPRPGARAAAPRARSARPTRPTPCAGCSACARPANRYAAA